MPRVLYSPSALRDLEEIGYHVAKDNPSAAKALLTRLGKTCDLLAEQSEMGESQPDIAAGQYRRFSVGNYVIYYSLVANGVWVARIFHAARDHERLL